MASDALSRALPECIILTATPEALARPRPVTIRKCPAGNRRAVSLPSAFLYLFYHSLERSNYYAADKEIWKIWLTELRSLGSILNINNKIVTQCFTSCCVD